MITGWSARERRVAYAVALAAVAAAAVVHYRGEGTSLPVDDAYITLHNAAVLRRGVDPELGVPAMVGATSPVHTVLLALLGVVFRGELAGWVGAWVGVAAYVTGVVALAVRHRLSRWDALLLVAVAVIVGDVPHQLMNGLETGLAMGALAWAIALTEPVDGPSVGPAQPLLCGVLPFLRPELSVASAGLLALRWLRLRRAGAFGLRRALVDVALALAGTAPWAALNLAQLGSLAPSTIGAKRLFFAEGCLPPRVRWDWAVGAVDRFLGTLGYLPRALLLWPLAGAGRVGMLVAAALFLAYETQFPGALGHYEYRYLYALLPFALASLAAARAHRAAWVRWAALLLAIVAVDTNAWNAKARWAEHRQRCAFTRAELAGLARFVRTSLPRDARLLVHDVGYVAFAGERRVVDLVGLKTPRAVELHRRLTWATCGMGRSDAVHQLALATRPTHLVVLDSWDSIYQIVGGLRAHGWKLEPARPVARYLVYALTPP